MASSFATEVKNEIARHFYERDCCRHAELAGLLRMGASLTLGTSRSLGLTFVTENAAVARKVLVLLKKIDRVMTETTVVRARRLKKKNSYRISVGASEVVTSLIYSLGLIQGSSPEAKKASSLFKKSCCRKAFLRGAFMSGGTVNRPEASYHLELVVSNYALAELLMSLFDKEDFFPRITERKGNYIVYFKESETITDILRSFEAEKAAEEIEVARNLREVRNQVNRLVNCETANMKKTVEAAALQVVSIKTLIDAKLFDTLPKKLKETAQARLAEPEASLAELSAELGVTRAAVSHRLHKLVSLAEEISKNEADEH